jgi:hypothetical protein
MDHIEALNRWHAGTRVTGLAEQAYRKLVARPIRSGWVRR